MRTTTARVAERLPLRSRLDDPAGSLRRGELAAGLATAAIVGQLLFAQVTLLAAVALVAVGRLSRWRPHWLALPALASLVWLRAVGPGVAAAGFREGARRLSGYLLGAAAHPGRLAHPAAAIAGAGAWLPRQLPLALLAATGEASFVLWLGWWRRDAGWRRQDACWRWRPGLVALVRGQVSATALAAGQTVTADGFAIGLTTATGKLAALSWAEATHGVLLTGQDADKLGLAVACAALRRRKTVLIVGRAAVVGQVRVLASSLGVPVAATGVAAAGAAARSPGVTVSGLIGRAIRSRETILIETSQADAAGQAVRDLARVLDSLRDLGLLADCLAWISECEAIDPAILTELLALGPATGTAIVLSTTSPPHVAHLAGSAGVVAASGPVGPELAAALAAPSRYWRPGEDAIGREGGNDAQLGATMPTSRPTETVAELGADCPSRTIASFLTRQRAGEFALLALAGADGRAPRVMTSCRAVSITAEHLR